MEARMVLLLLVKQRKATDQRLTALTPQLLREQQGQPRNNKTTTKVTLTKPGKGMPNMTNMAFQSINRSMSATLLSSNMYM